MLCYKRIKRLSPREAAFKLQRGGKRQRTGDRVGRGEVCGGCARGEAEALIVGHPLKRRVQQPRAESVPRADGPLYPLLGERERRNDGRLPRGVARKTELRAVQDDLFLDAEAEETLCYLREGLGSRAAVRVTAGDDIVAVDESRSMVAVHAIMVLF